MYLNPEKYGKCYGALQSTYAPGLIYVPAEFVDVFYQKDKRAAGFVKIEHDGEKVTSCIWDEEAYQEWERENPYAPVETVPIVTPQQQMRADIDYIAAMTGVDL